MPRLPRCQAQKTRFLLKVQWAPGHLLSSAALVLGLQEAEDALPCRLEARPSLLGDSARPSRLSLAQFCKYCLIAFVLFTGGVSLCNLYWPETLYM